MVMVLVGIVVIAVVLSMVMVVVVVVVVVIICKYIIVKSTINSRNGYGTSNVSIIVTVTLISRIS